MPDTVAARAALWAAISPFRCWRVRAPERRPRSRSSATPRRSAGSRAREADPPCDCGALPVDARIALGLPQALNTRERAALERVPGLGPVRAQAIVARARARRRDSTSLDALSSACAGIGARTIDRIRSHLYAVGPDPACGVGD